MGRKPKDLTIEHLKDRLLKEINNEYDPDRLSELLSCYMKVESILEKKHKTKEEKRQTKLAMPRVG